SCVTSPGTTAFEVTLRSQFRMSAPSVAERPAMSSLLPILSFINPEYGIAKRSDKLRILEARGFPALLPCIVAWLVCWLQKWATLYLAPPCVAGRAART